MAITRSTTLKKLSRRRAITTTGLCSCVWCKAWKPRRVCKVKKFSTRRSTQKTFTLHKTLPKNKAKSVASLPPSDPETSSHVDPAAESRLANLKCSLAHDGDGVPLNASLAFIDLANNVDEFFLLQVIKAGRYYFVFTKWGPTGTNGQTKLQGHLNFLNAFLSFHNTFLEKTGNMWASRSSFIKVDGKYDLLRPTSPIQESGSWKYYMDDFVDGKATGWHPYTVEGTAQTELLHQTHQTNSAYNRRIVQSGHFKYCIDLDEMTQTNIKTNKRRQIRRL
ncbi:unnamed protein product [Aphanomyces euteiches]